jgi:hypothetical protein
MLDVYNRSRKPEAGSRKPEAGSYGQSQRLCLEVCFLYAFHSNVFHFQDSNTITDKKKLFNGFCVKTGKT